MAIPKSTLDNFVARVTVSGDCWLWSGALTEKGYGVLTISGKHRVRAHRWAYEQAFGSIPDGMVIDHLCRRRSCVFPGHLNAVTPLQNTIAGEQGGYYFQNALLHTESGRTTWPSCPVDGRIRTERVVAE
jgi:hypothetical protein